MEKQLEQLVEKRAGTMEKVSAILQKDIAIEPEYALFLAQDVVNQAIGGTTLQEYEEHKLKEAEKKAEALKKQERQRKWSNFKWDVKHYGSRVLGTLLVLAVVSGAGFGIYSCNVAYPPGGSYPKVYTPIPEEVRFSQAYNSFSEAPKGLGSNNMCVRNYSMEKGDGPGCINPKKLAALNAALDKAVAEDINGLVWEEPNGNGEVWSVVRNNYRFVITGTKDPNYIDPKK